MNENITLAVVLQVLASSRPGTPCRYYLCAIDKKLALRSHENVPDHPDIIATLNARQVTGDFSTWKWQQIENRINFLIVKGKLCSPLLRH